MKSLPWLPILLALQSIIVNLYDSIMDIQTSKQTVKQHETTTNTMFEHQLATTTCPFLSSTRPSTAPSSVLSLAHGATSAAPASKCRYSAPGQHLAMMLGRHPEASFHDTMTIVWTVMLMMLIMMMMMTVRRRDTP